MLALLLSSRMRSEDVLHAIPGGVVDKRLVAAGVSDASVRNFTLVIGVVRILWRELT